MRRARALQDVLLPEPDRTLSDIETRLEELEQEDAIAMRPGQTTMRRRRDTTMTPMELRKTVLVGQSAERMFDLIEAAEHYPDFLPWCAAATIVERDDDVVAADSTVDYHGVRFGFRTRNPKRPPGVDGDATRARAVPPLRGRVAPDAARRGRLPDRLHAALRFRRAR